MHSVSRMDGGVHDWMRSYLQGRQQSVHINGVSSKSVDLQYGFPQGSCVGPFGFKLYTKPLTEIARPPRNQHPLVRR